MVYRRAGANRGDYTGRVRKAMAVRLRVIASLGQPRCNQRCSALVD